VVERDSSPGKLSNTGSRSCIYVVYIRRTNT
jgi:hypothetical protein